MGKSNELYDFQAELVHETENALLLKVFLVGKNDYEKVWFPRSVVQDNGDGTYTIPQKWAEDKGLV